MYTTHIPREAEDIQPLPARVEDAADTKQYSLTKILAIWATVTVPMGVLAWVVGPAIIPHASLHPGLVHGMLMVVGMMWQFVVSLAVLRHELGGLHWPTLKKRIWLNLPRSPHTGKPRKVLFLWALPAFAANGLGAYLATRLDSAWTNWLPGFDEPSYANPQAWVSQRRVSSTFFCSRLKRDSMAALSQAAPTRPMEPTRSLLSSSRRTFLEPNWLPRSECRIVPAGLRSAMALRIADAASRHPTRPA
jgi:hypothetical protein